MEGTLYEEVSSASYSENDISNSLKNGILYLEDPIDHVCDSQHPSSAVGWVEADVCFLIQTWTPHYFVLTSNKIYYSEETSHYQTADQEEEDEVKEVAR